MTKVALNSKENPKGFWKFVPNNTKTVISTFHLEWPNGGETSSDKEIAETLISHFISVFTLEDQEHITDFNPRILNEPLENFEITDDQIIKEIQR